MRTSSKVLVVLLLFAGCAPAPEDDREVLVFAAASLRDVLSEIAGPFQEATGLEPVFNFAGSNVLALQIEASSAADAYLSAHERWMDRLEDAKLLVDGTRRTFLSNRLVIVVHVDSSLELTHPAELADVELRFLSLADPAAVPAGIYARSFLESVPVDGTDLWTELRDRIAPAPDVRAALGMVEAHPGVVGVVYRTDAMASEKVRRLYEVPEELSPPIRYTAAAVRGAGQRRAERFLDFLAGAEAAAIFEEHGFLAVPET